MNNNPDQKPTGTQADESGCGCDGNCCPPKKDNMTKRIIFLVIILVAIGIIAIKLIDRPAASADKPACCPEGSTSCYDTTTAAACDTTDSTSCCPKK